MSSPLPPELIQKASGTEKYNAGIAFQLHRLGDHDGVIKAMGQVIRKVSEGKLEVGAGDRIVAMLDKLAKAIYSKKQLHLTERRLDLLGAAAEEGAAVFEGIAIIPPASRAASGSKAAAPAPVIDIEPGEAVKIKPAHIKPRKT